jgi:tyrocidine synthetase-3
MKRDQNRVVAPGIKKVEKRKYYPVSLQQEGVYLQSMLDPDNAVWNTSHSWRYRGPLDFSVFKNAAAELIRRHASLRTNFILRKEEILQVVQDSVPVDSVFRFEDLSTLPGNEKETAAIKIEEAEAKRPYNLASEPLIRFALMRLDPSDHVIVIGKHHIISDATSRQILWRELVTFYNASVTGEPAGPEPLEIDYYDYALWEREFISSPSYQEEKAYWLKQLDGTLPLLNLPADFPRGENRRSGTVIAQEMLDETLTTRLRSFGLRNRMTFSTAFLAAFYLLLHRYAGQDDIVIGGLYRGRNFDKNLNKIIGLFANRIAMRLNPDDPDELPVKELLAIVDKKIVDAYKNQDFLFEDLIRTIHPERGETHAPVSQAVFNMVKIPGADLDFHGLERLQWEGSDLDTNITSQYDLSLYIRDDLKTLTVKILYSKNLFREETVKRILACYITLLSEIVMQPQKTVSALEIVTPEEKQRLLYHLNNTARHYPAGKTIHCLLEEQAERTPHAAAVNDVTGSCLTYRALNRRAGGLASLLRHRGVETGTIVGLMIRRSAELIVAIYGILKAGAAYLPIDPDYPQDRIEYMLKESRAGILLKSEIRNPKSRYFKQISNDRNSNDRNRAEFPLVLNFEHLNFETGCPRRGLVSDFDIRISDLNSANLAYVIYTSGSTGKPKGVMIRHRSVINFIEGITRIIDFSPGKAILALTTVSFDIFVLETLLPLSRGLRVVMADEKQQLEMSLLEELIVNSRVDMLQATPTRMQLFAAAEPSSTCLRRLKEIMVGGEALPPDLLENLTTLTKARIYNMYGPTETTVWSTVRDLTDAGAVDIGRPIANTQIYILDQHHNLQPEGASGELCIGGDGLALGYLNRPELTAERFFYRSNRTCTLYKTGDLARWLHNSNLQCLGRIDNQVKIRGFRVELEEIQSALNNHPGITDSVVLAVDTEKGNKSLCAYLVPSNAEDLDITALRDHLGLKLPAYMVPSYFVTLEKIPLTPNGKVDRKTLAKPTTENSLRPETAYTPPQNEKQEKLALVWQDVLGLEQVGIDDNFIAVGGDSIKAIQVISRLKGYGYKLDIAALFKHLTIAAVSPHVETITTEQETLYPPSELRARQLSPDELASIQHHFGRENISHIYHLSPMQEGMLFHHLYDPGNRAYIVQLNYQLDGHVDTVLFETCCRQLVKRHEVFRTAFVYDRVKVPVQVILKDRDIAYAYHDISHDISLSPGTSGSEAEHIHRIAAEDRERDFHLLDDPLLRFALIRTKAHTYRLLVTFHHIIMDGWSTNLWLKDFLALYRQGGVMPETGSPYIPYSNYLKWLETQDETAAHNYWRGYLETFEQGTSVRPSIPPAGATYERQDHTVEIPRETYDRLSELTAAKGVTLNNLLLGVWGVVLHRRAGSDDVVFGNVISGRNIPLEGIERITGLFINTIPMRIKIEDPRQTTFTRMLEQIRSSLLESQEYGYLQLSGVQQHAHIEGPLFDHIFIYENYPVYRQLSSPEQARKTGFRLTRKYSIERTNYDLNIIIIPREKLLIRFVYNENVYDTAFITRLAGNIRQVIEEVLKQPDPPVSDIEIITPEEKQRLLHDLNNTAHHYPAEKTIHHLLEEQAARTPHAIAVNGANKTYLSYREINRRADRLASLLRHRGIETGTIVGLMIGRSVELLTAIYGILKAGAAYLPIDPAHPQDRIDYMLKESGAGILLKSEIRNPKSRYFKQISNDRNRAEFPLVLNFEHLNFETGYPRRGRVSDLDTRISDLNSANLAYVIYTSGSTGKPKGVMIGHRSVINFIEGIARLIDFSPWKTILALTTVSFDIFVLETLLPLSRGLRVVIADEKQQMEMTLLEELIVKSRVDMLQATPTRMQLFTAVEPSSSCLRSLKEIMVGGEALPPDLLESLKTLTNARIYNMYGPTETTVWSTVRDLTDAVAIDIGRPIANTRIYILGQHYNLQPEGTPGELCIGGDGLALGYLNRPELTVDKFFNSSDRSNRSYILYRTGDLARWLPGNNLQCLGRIDNQVKIRGNRIELGEIETSLNKHPAVKKSVTIAVNDSSGKTLCAYFVPMENNHRDITAEQLREFLGKELPDYMIPSHFIPIEKIPLTANGKVDRKSLPQPDHTLRSGTAYTPPTNPIEEKLVAIWQDILRIDTIGIHDSFFSLGGHSLRVMNLAAQIRTTFRMEIPLRELFDRPTIAQVAAIIKARDDKMEKFIRILEEIEAMSEEDARFHLSQPGTAHPEKSG